MAQLTKAKEHNVKAIKEASTQDESTDPRLTEAELALQQTEKVGKDAEIRRAEEKHMQDLAHADEAHNVKKAIDTTKTAHDIAIKGKTAEADIKMKEKMTQAGIQAKRIAAKQKKVTKPAKKG